MREFDPDILQLHWLGAGFIRIEDLPQFRTRQLVWRLPDMWPFTGAEHYVGNSKRYLTGYKTSNRESNETGWDYNFWAWKRKQRAYKKIPKLAIVCPSRWLAECAKQSILFKDRRVEVIPTGQNMHIFSPTDKHTARNKLRLPKHEKILLFGAIGATSDRRKGYDLLQKALRRLAEQLDPSGIVVAVFGDPHQPVSCVASDFRIRFLGKFSEDLSLSLVYSACDVFVAPSREENLANTVIEAMGCGLPVVAFNIGGMPDIISHKRNGYLASALCPDDLARGIHWALKDDTRLQSMSLSARETVRETFSQTTQAESYERLYADLLSANSQIASSPNSVAPC